MVLKGMFHPDELVAEPSYKEELEADLKTECAKLGPVDKVGREPARLGLQGRWARSE